MDAAKAILGWYLNRYSTGYNQDCDICWAGYIAIMHFLYGALPFKTAVFVFFAGQAYKALVPTDYDRENA